MFEGESTRLSPVIWHHGAGVGVGEDGRIRPVLDGESDGNEAETPLMTPASSVSSTTSTTTSDSSGSANSTINNRITCIVCGVRKRAGKSGYNCLYCLFCGETFCSTEHFQVFHSQNIAQAVIITTEEEETERTSLEVPEPAETQQGKKKRRSNQLTFDLSKVPKFNLKQ